MNDPGSRSPCLELRLDQVLHAAVESLAEPKQGYRRGVEEASVVFQMPAVSSERKAKEERAMVFSIADLEALLAEVLA